MIYIFEKCGTVYKADQTLTECESCGCTCISKANEREVIEIVGSILLNGDESVLLHENKKGEKRYR